MVFFRSSYSLKFFVVIDLHEVTFFDRQLFQLYVAAFLFSPYLFCLSRSGLSIPWFFSWFSPYLLSLLCPFLSDQKSPCWEELHPLSFGPWKVWCKCPSPRPEATDTPAVTIWHRMKTCSLRRVQSNCNLLLGPFFNWTGG